MILVTRKIHIYRVVLYITFQRMSLYGQNGRVAIVELLLFNVVGSTPASKAPVTNTYR